MGDAPSGPALALPLFDAAALVGAYRWTEARLFELTGKWSLAVPDPAIRIHLAEISLQHGWHAELWWDRLPVLASVDRATLVCPPAQTETALDLLAAGPADFAEDSPEAWTWRLAGLVRVVLPRLLSSYGSHLNRATPQTDGPVKRALRLCSRDLTDTLPTGKILVERAILEGHGVEAAGAGVAATDAVFTRNGLASGLLPWPTGRSSESTP